MQLVTTLRLAGIVGAAGLGLAALSVGTRGHVEVPPDVKAGPDLNLVWSEELVPAQDQPLSLVAGTPRDLVVRVVNAGSVEAPEVTVQTVTPLGRSGSTIELGTLDTSASVELTLPLTPAVGMREVCVVVASRNQAGQPADPTPSNNRLCQRLQVQEPIDSTEETP